MDYCIHLAILICIYLILAQSFNLAFGLGGLFNLAHISAYALGAYTTALLSTNMDQTFLVCIISSMAFSAFFSLLLGLISIKLSHNYFAVGSLAFSAIISTLLINWRSLTRGVLGITNIPRPILLNIDFQNNLNFLAFCLIFTIVALIVFYLLFHSYFARNLKIQAENTFFTSALGKNVILIRRDALIVSSIMAGLAGSLYAYYISYIDPSSFMLSEMVFVMSIVILGKPGSFWGVIVATVFLVLLPEPLRYTNLDSNAIGPMRQLLYALIIFIAVYFRREKLFQEEQN
jgi:branched-chain amino acid transport system permease protein